MNDCGGGREGLSDLRTVTGRWTAVQEEATKAWDERSEDYVFARRHVVTSAITSLQAWETKPAYSVTVPNGASVETHSSQYPKEVELNLYRVPRRAALHL